MTKIFIVDDHLLVREGLKKVLRTESYFTIVGEAENGTRALEQLETCRCDVLLLDIALSDINGLEILKQVKAFYPAMRVLILSIYPEGRYAVRAMKDGADGYLTKNSAADELISAIQLVMTGKKYISPAFAQNLVDPSQNDQKQSAHEKLSDREFQILLLIGSGHTVTQIADKLCLSVSTVNTHRSHILEKMNFNSNVELIRYVLENHLDE